MRKWWYSLNYAGKTLRQTISDGGEDLQSCKETLKALDWCYQEIKRKLAEDDWMEIELEYDLLQSLMRIIDIADEAEREDRLIDIGYDGFNPALDAVNDVLSVFYDVCDNYSIWIGL